MDIKVSVIIPTYRRDRTLEKAVQSVINQSYSNIEIIVVDDNDPSSEFGYQVEVMITKMQTIYTNIVYLRNSSNLGSAKTRNIGIFNATGEYITFLDDDDIYEPDKIIKQLTFMEKNSLDMSFTDLVLKNDYEKIVDVRRRDNLKHYDTNTLLKYHLMYHITGTDTFMYKNDFLKGIGGFDSIDIGDEFYLMVKTIKSSAKIGYLPSSEVVAYIHNNKGGLSTGDNKITGENNLYEFKKKFFYKLTLREKMFVRFRHHAVLAVTGLRSKDFLLLFKHSFLAAVASPLDTVIEPIGFIKRIMSTKHENIKNGYLDL
ncbi:glycosyltransferase family 2 protein [Ectobacillus sp. sgz5001026]|uniref:glycosyltransferase family 2 protein n=1 Tax=Ectobacillus sp. sgz5001026 TaxID=3242473 RepID=UPI0036D292A1